MHHATVDGVSGANLISHLCSLEPDAPPLGAEPRRGTAARARPAPSCSAARVLTTVTRPLTPYGLLAPSAQLRRQDRSAGPAPGTAMAAPFTAPRTSFNGTITGQRAIALADMDLDDIKADQERHRHHRQRRGAGRRRRRAALLPRGPRRAAATARCWRPCRCRCARSRGARTGANKVSALFAKLGTDIEDPLERLRGPGRAPTARQGAPQGDQRRLAAGLGRVRRAADLRPRRPRLRRRCGSPSSTRSCTTW